MHLLLALSFLIHASVAQSTYWYANILHNGLNPQQSQKWTVFRNVHDYGALGDGKTDDAIAIRSALSIGDNVAARGSGWWGTTAQPVVLFFPPGTYLVSSTLQNYIGTVRMGDPTARPVIKASPDFRGSVMIKGTDPKFQGLVAFYTEMKNLVFDSTSVGAEENFTLVDWSVSQGCLLSNSVFNMPPGASGHTAITTTGMNSPLLLNDLEIRGGGSGYVGSSTQYHFKSIYFKSVRTGIRPTSMVQITVQGCVFEGVNVGVEISGDTLGMLNLIDSRASDTKVLVKTDQDRNDGVGSLALENVIVDSTVAATVMARSVMLLKGPVAPGNTWIRGTVYTGRAVPIRPQKLTGEMVATSRPPPLVNTTYFYHTVLPPTYADFALDQIINVRDVSAHPVAGDGITDDTKSLQVILNTAANAGKILYFPHGRYLISDTLLFPPGSRVWGESFTELSVSGPRFQDPKHPKPVFKIGEPGDVGIAQFTDIVFTVQDILPGAILVEVNMAGSKPGDVGFFNTHFRFGGAHGSKPNTCKTVEDCRAVYIAAYLTTFSSSYWENTWAWAADHDLDGFDGFGAYPSPAEGFLIEAQKGTWMLGLGVEHFALYLVTIRDAASVFIGLQQGEAAYYQGLGNTSLPPAPWEADLLVSDPDFSWCAPNNATCRMSIYQRVLNSSSVNLYSGGYWNFVAGPNRTFCSSDCQNSAVFYENNTKLFSYGVAAINNANLVVETGTGRDDFVAVRSRKDHEGIRKYAFSSSLMAAYLRQWD